MSPRFKSSLTLVLPLQLKQEMGNMVMNIIQNYNVNASSIHEENMQEAWDYVQAQVGRAGGNTRWHGTSGVWMSGQ